MYWIGRELDQIRKRTSEAARRTDAPLFLRQIALVQGEDVRPAGWFSDNGLIRNDDRCSRLQLIGKLVREFRTKVQTRRHGVGIHALALTRHP